MKKAAILLALAAIGSFGFAQSVTQSLYYGDVNLQMGNGDDPINHGIVGVGYREISTVRDHGFYYGADLFVGAPVITTECPDDEPSVSLSNMDLYASLKAPLGYRWPGERKAMGFYLGAGPAAHVLTDFDQSVVGAFGGFVEIGWQTNKTAGVGFHVGLQMGGCPLIYEGGNELRWDDEATHATLQLGMSWRRLGERW